MRKNIMCIKSNLIINTPPKGDGSNVNTSLWIVTSDGCEVSGIEHSSPFFIPTLTRADATLDANTSYLSITFTGTNLIPCNLTYNITFSDSTFSHSNITTFESDTTAMAEVSASEYDRYRSSERVGVSLVYGPSNAETAIYSLKQPAFQSNHTSTLGIIVATVLPLLVLLLIGIVLIVLCCMFRRHVSGEEEKVTEKKLIYTEQKPSTPLVQPQHQIAHDIGEMMDGVEEEEEKDEQEEDEDGFSSEESAVHCERVYAIPSTPPHTLVTVQSHTPLASLIHTQSERDRHNVERWGVRVALQACDIALYLTSLLYPRHSSTPHSPSSNLSLSQFQWMLHSLNPHTLTYTSSHKVVLAYIDADTPISILPSRGAFNRSKRSGGRSSTLGEESKRWECKEMLLHSKTANRRVSERNSVYAIGLILYEIVSDEIAFSNLKTPDVVRYVSEGGLPDLNGLRGKDKVLKRIISSTLVSKGKHSLTLRGLKEQLERYVESMDDEVTTLDSSEDEVQKKSEVYSSTSSSAIE